MAKIHGLMDRLFLEAVARIDGGRSALNAAGSASEFHAITGDTLRGILKNARPGTLGEIGAKGISWYHTRNGDSGRTSVYEVHFGTWIGKYDSGRTILVDLAAAAIIAHAWDSRFLLFPDLFTEEISDEEEAVPQCSVR